MRVVAVFLVCLASACAGKAFDPSRVTTEVIGGTPRAVERVVTEDCPDPLRCDN